MNTKLVLSLLTVLSVAIAFPLSAAAQQTSCISEGAQFDPNSGNTHFGGNNGADNEASGGNATAGGINARATATSATAIGDSALASGEGSSAYGTSATASGCLSTATGALSTASGNQATASGYNSSASGDGAVATGSGANASGNLAVATGTIATATGDNSTATGFNSQATAANTTASGANSKASATNATASGAGAQANHTNSVALGANTRTDGTNQVAVGYRTVSQVADGRIAQDSFDAVNGRQIWALEQDWNDRWTNVTRRMDGFDKRIDAVGAQAASMAMMAGASTYLPVGKIAISAGYGQYGSGKAFAVGAKARLTERASASVGLSSTGGSEGKLMIGAGFSYMLE